MPGVAPCLLGVYRPVPIRSPGDSEELLISSLNVRVWHKTQVLKIGDVKVISHIWGSVCLPARGQAQTSIRAPAFSRGLPTSPGMLFREAQPQ